MIKLEIIGEAFTTYPNLEELDGIDCHDNFVDYMDDDYDLQSGYMSFKYNKEDGKLYTVTTYYGDRNLTPEEILDIINYTKGQWSDGIGEGFEQEPCLHSEELYNNNGEMTREIFISPCHPTQTVEYKISSNL